MNPAIIGMPAEGGEDSGFSLQLPPFLGKLLDHPWAEGFPIQEVGSNILFHLNCATALDGIILSAFLMRKLRFRVVRVTSKDQEMQGFTQRFLISHPGIPC